MAVAVPQKIILRSATGLTLNERFSNIAKLKPVLDIKPERVQMVADRHEASIVAERLALYNRTRVKSEQDSDHWRTESTTYMTNRLGSTPITQRLGMAYHDGYTGRGRRPWRSVLEDSLRGVSDGYVDTRNYSSPWYSSGWGNNPYRYDRYPPRWLEEDYFDDQQSPYGDMILNRVGVSTPTRIMVDNSNQHGVYFYRGGVGRGSTQGVWQATGRGRGRSRGQYNYRGHRGGYRGQRWRRGQYSRSRRGGRGGYREHYRPSVTKEELDNEIDEYMSKTRTEVNLFVG